MSQDKILKMPNMVKKAIPNPFFKEIPKEAEGTDSYAMTTVHYAPAPLKVVPDIMSGTKRNRKWGCLVTLGIVPGLSDTKGGNAIMPQMPAQFFDADDLDALRARIIHELDKAIDLARLQTVDPERFEQCHEEFISSLQSETEEKV